MRQKIALFANVDVDAVIEARDAKTIYEVPLQYRQQRLDDLICERLGLHVPKPDLAAWREMVERIKEPKHGRVRIAVVGKYVALVDCVQVGAGGAHPRRHRQRRGRRDRLALRPRISRAAPARSSSRATTGS